jgi:hypothetical protein
VALCKRWKHAEQRVEIDGYLAHGCTADAREREQIVDQLAHELRGFTHASETQACNGISEPSTRY